MVMFDHKVGRSSSSHRSCRLFIECVLDCNLFDAGFHGPSFTWHRNSWQEQLDHALMNQDWALSFHVVGVIHLPNFNSDHCPIWIRVGDVFVPRSPKPFKFLVAWLSRSDFG